MRAWLTAPVAHLRDVRSALLLKLVLLERLGLDPAELITAQRHQFTSVLGERAVTPPDGDVIGLWRHHLSAAVDAFLHELEGHDSEPSPTRT